MDYTLSALDTTALSIGKGSIFRAAEFTGAADLTLTHLGDTQGDITFNAAEKIGGLKLPEWYGDAYVRSHVIGAEPVLTAPLFLATPALRNTVSPTGDGLIANGGRRTIVRHTLVVFPQALFWNATDSDYSATLRYTSALGWQKVIGGTPAALTADETRLLGLSIWLWSGFFERPPITFRATVDDELVDVETVTFRAMRNEAGYPLVTIGSPITHGINIDIA